jgi:hypothetical protein
MLLRRGVIRDWSRGRVCDFLVSVVMGPKGVERSLSIAAIAVPLLGNAGGRLAAILGQRSTDVVAFLEGSVLPSTDKSLVGPGVDQFALRGLGTFSHDSKTATRMPSCSTRLRRALTVADTVDLRMYGPVARHEQSPTLSGRNGGIGRRSSTKSLYKEFDEIFFGSAGGEVDVRLRERVDQRANDMRAADGRAACRADVGAQPVQKHDLTVHEDHCDLGPMFGM